MNEFRDRLIDDFWMKRKHDSIELTDIDLKEYLEKHSKNYPKGTTIDTDKNKLMEAARMKRFQEIVDKELSQMKEEAKIEYK